MCLKQLFGFKWLTRNLPVLALLLLSQFSSFAHAVAVTSADPVPLPACGVTSGSQVNLPVSVLDPSGAALTDARIRLSCGTVSVTGRTGADGVAHLSLLPGTWLLTVQSDGFAAENRAVTVESSIKSPLVVSMRVGSAADSVTVTADAGYVAYSSEAGSKMDVPLIEVPQSISVVNQQELKSRNVTTVNEALRYTPGVQADEYGVEQRYDWLKIRGFTADTYGVFRDGMRWNSLAGKMDPYELESVEIIKGPSSVLYGEAPPGGLVNLVTKRPPLEALRELRMQFGSYDSRQVQDDFGGPIGHSGIWSYRLTGLVRNSGTQVDYTPDNRRMIAPALTWRPTPRTTVTAMGDWQHDKTRWSQFLPASGTLYNDNPNGVIPVDTFVGEPGWEKVIRDQASLGYTADHHFVDGWGLHQNFRYQHANFQGSTVYGVGFVAGSSELLNRFAVTYPQWNDIYTVDTRSTRRFTKGIWEHAVLAGYDYTHLSTKTRAGFAVVDPINVFHPVYGAAIPAMVSYNDTDVLLDQHGAYAQDQIKLKQHLVFTLGGREDWAIDDVKNLASNTATHQKDAKFTGRAGITWLTSAGIAPYFSYSTSFQPTAGVNYYGQPYKPSNGKQEEVGVKLQPRTWNGFFTASFFNIDQTNVQTTDPANPLNSVQTASVNSRGVEFEALANVARGLNLHAGYSLVRTDAGAGAWLPQTPRNQASLLADYTASEGALRGFGGNAGVRFVGQGMGDSANTIAIPNYTLFDGAVRYRWRAAQLGLNATNLFDRRYVATCTGLAYCGYGFARNVTGAVEYHF
jgi:iron complex outermembrane receptor protein